MLRDQTVAGIVGALLIGFAALLVAGFAVLAFTLGELAARPIAITGGLLVGMLLALAWLILHRLAQPLDRRLPAGNYAAASTSQQGPDRSDSGRAAPVRAAKHRQLADPVRA